MVTMLSNWAVVGASWCLFTWFKCYGGYISIPWLVSPYVWIHLNTSFCLSRGATFPQHVSFDWSCLKSMELVPPNSKKGTIPTQDIIIRLCVEKWRKMPMLLLNENLRYVQSKKIIEKVKSWCRLKYLLWLRFPRIFFEVSAQSKQPFSILKGGKRPYFSWFFLRTLRLLERNSLGHFCLWK